jgi:GFO/IDH/MocA oxidoreductase family protein
VKVPPESQIPQFQGHPAGGPQRAAQAHAAPWVEPKNERASNDLLASHARNFLDCVKSREKPNADVEDAHRVATACHLANISLRLDRKVQWDAEAEEVIGDPAASSALIRPYRKPWDEVLRSLKL